MKLFAAFVIIIMIMTIPSGLYAHSGRTDSSGGHHNRIHGGYHYHNSGSNSDSGSFPVLFATFLMILILVFFILSCASCEHEKYTIFRYIGAICIIILIICFISTGDCEPIFYGVCTFIFLVWWCVVFELNKKNMK